MPKAKNERFENVYSQGGLSTMEIWVDKETGVNYLFRTEGYAGGMTPLLDRDGKPVNFKQPPVCCGEGRRSAGKNALPGFEIAGSGCYHIKYL